jgi:hypothetical protein
MQRSQYCRVLIVVPGCSVATVLPRAVLIATPVCQFTRFS